jgi:hypothetical protein
MEPVAAQINQARREAESSGEASSSSTDGSSSSSDIGSSSDAGSSSSSSSSELPSADDGGVIYYGKRGASVLIDVHVLNPSQYEILSFTLNGYKYQSYQFQDGSDSENLYLKVNLPEDSGYASYSIDAIKYIDGTETKDANMSEAAKTVKAGVTYDTIPSADVSSVNAGYVDYSSSVYLLDESKLVSDNGFKAHLSDAYGAEISEKELSVGKNDLSFSGLEMNANYTCTITATCDILDGAGETDLKIYESPFVTKEGVSIETLEPSKTSVSYSISSKIQDLSVTSVAVTDSRGDIAGTSTEKSDIINGLLTNNDYKLKADYTYGAHSGSVSKDFATLSNAVPSFSFKDVVASKTGVAFGYEFSDGDAVGSLKSIVLKDGGSAVGSIANLSSSGNSFSGLLSNHEYSLEATCSYDLGDGNGLSSKTFDSTFRTGAKVAPVIAIQNVDPGQASATFEVAKTDDDAICTIDSVSIYKGEALKEKASDISVRAFTGLLSDNSYDIKVEYSYDLNDGTGKTTKVAAKSFKTLSKATPTVLIDNVTPTQTSASFSLDTTDADGVLSVKSIALYKGETQVEIADSTAVTSFDGLLSNTTYTIKAAYSYDLNDGKGAIEMVSSESFTTIAKAAPTISFENVSKGETSVSGQLAISDVDSTLSFGDIGLYSGGSLLKSSSGTSFSFDSLSAYTQYSVQLPYSYDLNDGAGKHNETLKKDIKTDPHFALTETTVINTSAVSEGETIVLQASLENPQKATTISVEVNGRDYAVSSASTTSKIRVEIIDEGQFEGGETELKIDKISLSLDGNSYEVSSDSNNKGSIFVNGALSLKNLSFCKNDGLEYVESSYFLPGEDVYYLVTIANKTGYDIDSIIIGGTTYSSSDIISIDDNHKAIKCVSFTGEKCVSISSISYSNTSLSKTISSSKTAFCYSLASSDTIEIKDKNDLLNMNGGCLYSLQNDIDLSGSEWVGGDFSGVFEGNGHSINNLTVVKTVEDQNLVSGLFKSAKGIIKNLTVADTTIICTIETNDSSSHSATVGAFAATCNGLLLASCYSKDNSISITNNTDQYALWNGNGGFVGNATNLFVRKSEATGTISNSKASVGGIAGLVSQFFTCEDTIVDITGTGGMCAVSSTFGFSSGCTMEFTRFINASNNTKFGGWLFSTGIINVCDSLNLSNGGFDSLDGTLSIINSYWTQANDYGFVVKGLDYFGKDFFQKTLSFSSDVWVLENIDVSSGVYPSLVNFPTD